MLKDYQLGNSMISILDYRDWFDEGIKLLEKDVHAFL
jgi:hypothetical protein